MQNKANHDLCECCGKVEVYDCKACKKCKESIDRDLQAVNNGGQVLQYIGGFDNEVMVR